MKHQIKNKLRMRERERENERKLQKSNFVSNDFRLQVQLRPEQRDRGNGSPRRDSGQNSEDLGRPRDPRGPRLREEEVESVLGEQRRRIVW